MSDGDRHELSPLKRAYLALEEMEGRLEAAESAGREPIALVGIGCRLPGGVETPDDFWRLLRNGVDTVSEVPHDRWDADALHDPDPETPGAIASRFGAFLDHVDLFDPEFFGIAPREAAAMDPQHRLLLEVAWEALEHAGHAPDSLAGSRTGVFVGIVNGDYGQLQLEAGGREGIGPHYGSGNARSIASGRLSYVLGLQGPSLSIDTACSSSLVAVHLAVRSLRAGESDLALAGGVNVILSPETSIALSKLRMLAPDGRCKTFDAAADGYVRGEGCALVVLKRLSDALADGDRVLAVVRGSAVNQDGEASSLTAPNGPAQERVVREALRDGGVAPADVGYVEAHGTGTSLGDPIEVQALAAVLGPGRDRGAPLAIGSVKTNVGHLESAAGVASLVKTVLALEHREIPPHLHLSTPNPHLRWDRLPVVVPTEPTPWPEGAPLYAGVSSFGFSGTNAHVVLEAAPPQEPVPAGRERPLHVLTVSALSSEALRESARRLARFLRDRPDARLADVAYSQNVGRARFAHRLALVAAGGPEAAAGLEAAAGGESLPAGAAVARVDGDSPRVAFLFSGQGAQYAGMGAELYATQPTFRASLERCDELFRPHLDRSLLAVLFPGAGEPSPIDETGWAQPALFALEVALAELLVTWGIRPSAVLGHSVGEYAAACAAGLLGLADGVALVAERARLMQDLPRGAMAAVSSDEEQVAAALERHGGDAVIACVNGPARVVVSGTEGDVESLLRELGREGIETRRLRVSHAFHSPLVEPMLDAFEHAASRVEFAAPAAMFVSSSTGAAETHAVLSSPAYWRRQVREPVRFAEAVASLGALECDLVVEVGPRPTLLGMARQCLPGAAVTWLPTLTREDPWRSLLTSVASLAAHGAEIDWRGFDRPYPRRRLALPTTPFRRSRHWFAAFTSTGRPRADGAHPLLGERRDSPLREVQLERELDAGRLALLGDHRVHGRAILPAMGFVELALAAGRLVLGSVPGVDDLAIPAALAFPDGGSRLVHTVVRPEDGGEASLEVWSAEPGRGAEPAAWQLHATARLVPARPGGPARAPESIEELRGRLDEIVTAEDHYSALAARGIELGPSLRGIREIRRRDGEALARVSLPQSRAAGYELDPALADACLQALAAAISGEAGTDAFLPLGLDAVRIHRSPGEAAWSHATLRPGDGSRTLVGDVRILDEEGALVAELTGVRLARAVPPEASPERLDAWLYEVAWRPAPISTRAVDPSAIAARVEPAVTELARRHRLDEHRTLREELDRAATGYAVAALRELGWEPRLGERVSRAALADRLGVAERHRQLVGRLLEMLAEDGVLDGTDSEWTARELPAPDSPDPALDALAERGPAERVQVELVRRCGRSLAAVLSGRAEPLELLFPGGSLEAVETLYRDSAEGRVFSGLAAAVIQAALAELPATRPVRVLELGAGTGSTTASVLQLLRPERAEYLFTDVSPRFLAHASERFGDVPFLRTAILDLELDPEEQGIHVGGFDVVLAADVLHATSDLRRSLASARRLLAPGGLLVLVEGTAPERWIDITFGLTEGWWRFRDHDLRRSSPLLTGEAWLDLLAAEGFEEPRAITREAESNQAVLVARAPRRAPSRARPAADGAWLVLADEGGVGEHLAERLEAEGERCILARIGVDADPARRDSLERLLAEAAAGASLRGIVHLWSLDLAAADDAAGGSLAAGQLQAAGGVLHLAQALAARTGRDAAAPRLWLVTCGARRVERGDEPPLAVEQAPLWGLAKVLSLEHPELGCVCVDLDPFAEDGVEQLRAELRDEEGEREVALRNGERYVARLARVGESREGDTPPVRLRPSPDGVLEHVALEPARRRAPGRGEVEIRVRATGLNFRDVLNALTLREDPEPLGSECAGTVVAVGEGVDDLSPGDEVVAVAPGSFATFAIARAALVAPRPPGLSAPQAATIPLAYMTARYALERAGRLAAGERVLVQAAAGGVGLAAVRIARRAGAEVIATAGSPEKRRFLRDLGVEHVFDSRTLGFANELLEATGGRGVDLLLNSLAGEAIPAGFSALAPDGRFLELGKREIWSAEQAARARPDVEYHVVDLAELLVADSPVVHELFREIVADAASGDLEPLPLTAFALERAADAFRYLAHARHRGKVVLVQEEPRALGDLVRDDASYLVTGGLAGLGLETARRLVERGARHLVLTGRNAPYDDSRRAIAALESEGARVAIALGDVSRLEDVVAAVALAEEMGPLRGVVHSAGVLDDGVLVRQEWERFRSVLAPKLDGAWNLHLGTRGRELDFFVLFSSSAALLGSAGQGNHAAANAFLDALAHYRRALGLPALSVDWGVWSEVGSAARRGVPERVALEGATPIRPHEGVEALDRASLRGGAQVAVLPVDWPRYLAQEERRTPFLSELAAETPAPRADRSRAGGSERSDLLEALAKGAPSRRRELLTGYVCEHAARILGLAGELDEDRPLQELGLDSLMAVELRNHLGAGLGLARPLPATLAFDHPTVRAIAGYLQAELGGAAAGEGNGAGPSEPAPGTREDLVDVIASLSDEDVERLLTERGPEGALG